MSPSPMTVTASGCGTLPQKVSSCPGGADEGRGLGVGRVVVVTGGAVTVVGVGRGLLVPPPQPYRSRVEDKGVLKYGVFQ